MKHFFFSYSGLFSALAEWLMLSYGCLPSTQEHPFRFGPISPHSLWQELLQHRHTTAVLRLPCQQIDGAFFCYPWEADSSIFTCLTPGRVCQGRKEIHTWARAAFASSIWVPLQRNPAGLDCAGLDDVPSITSLVAASQLSSTNMSQLRHTVTGRKPADAKEAEWANEC